VALQEGEPGMEEFASVLEPVLGECSTLYPGWLEKLPEYIRELTQCASLNDLARREVIEKARDLKREAGDRYFGSSALLAFAHYNFHARRTFFRLLHSDLISIRSGLIALEQRGVKQVNCSAAGLSNNMPVGELKRVVQQWKRVFESDYAQGYSFLSIAGLREAVTTALESSAVVSADFKLQEAAVATPVEEEREEDPGLGYVVAKIAEELDKRRDELLGKNLAIAKVTIEGQILILASWEVAAFLDSSGEYAEALRRAVAGRASIAMSIGTNRFAAALASAQVQTAQLQELVAQARERKDIDAAVNLAASAKRLTALVEQSSSMAHGAGR
jgi:hypothetical protein